VSYLFEVNHLSLCLYSFFSVLLRRESIFAVVISLIGYLFFWVLKWEWLRILVAKITNILLLVTGFGVQREEFTLVIGSMRFYITQECTYADWFFVTVPFIYKLLPAKNKIMWLILVALSLFVFNIGRIYFAIAMNILGDSWFIVHNCISHIFWLSSFGCIVFLWFQKQLYHGVKGVGSNNPSEVK